MNICGIVCEYNPFHNGHAYQISEIRRRLGEDTAIVCAMSGDFVQRGEPAAYAKHDRARAAVMGGANLVIELPLPWSIASAEGFARGGVGLLASSGVVTHLAFGSECGDLNILRKTAELLLRPETDALIRLELESGKGYAAARQSALERINGRAVPLLECPNDILAVEYLKAIISGNLQLQPVAIQRRGAAHDSGCVGEFVSASLLRRKIDSGEDIAMWMPKESFTALEQGNGPADRMMLETAILSRLRFLPETAFAALPDVGEGLYHRVHHAVRSETSLEAIVKAASTKRYPESRIRRICLCAALGIKNGESDGIPGYIRVLAADGRGLELLRRMEETCALPVVIKPAKVRDLDTSTQRVFEAGAKAADLYCLGYTQSSARVCDTDWRTSPFVVKENYNSV